VLVGTGKSLNFLKILKRFEYKLISNFRVEIGILKLFSFQMDIEIRVNLC
jgi:hypothetical protein